MSIGKLVETVGSHGRSGATGLEDTHYMAMAVQAAAAAQWSTSPNPRVGAVIASPSGEIVGEGVTCPPPGRHAEVVALEAAGDRATGATLYTTLEPCSHHGRTPPCADALVAAGIRRVVVALEDPDPQVAGAGLAALRAAGVEVQVGVAADLAGEQLAAYLKHRRTGRPLVVLKLATTLDGRTAAPDGSSRWITGPEARRDAHLLRQQSDAVLVGVGTVRADDPELTVRLDTAAGADPRDVATRDHGTAQAAPSARQPLRVVLGRVPDGARVLPALEMSGELDAVLDELGRRDVLQLLVEGGASVARDFHAAGLVDRYVVYVAPALLGGDDGRPVLAGPGARTMDQVWRGRLRSVRTLGDDIRIEVEPRDEAPATGSGPTEGQVG
jgi:diaminohydroxyphosphoribosylaminopyrimidine deaminase/5-amino-6-(5-phosphoribosylamino)uracil reductase